MEFAVIRIAPDSNDKRESVFASLNGKGYTINVNVDAKVPYSLYSEVLSKGNLKNRIALLRTE